MQGLREHADDPAFQEKWREVKQIAKSKAVEKIAQITGEEIPPHALLDIQVGVTCTVSGQLCAARGSCSSNLLPVTISQLYKPASMCCNALSARLLTCAVPGLLR